jgi:dTDP-4-amino-4,6-dideoxygalactose transaminase
LPVSEQATDHTIILPLFPRMSATEQNRVVAALRQL